MNRYLTNGLTVILLLQPIVAAAEQIPVNLKRLSKDHYQSTDELLNITTRFCYEDAYTDDALLIFEPYGLENKLKFRSGTNCEVLTVYDRNAHEVRTLRSMYPAR